MRYELQLHDQRMHIAQSRRDGLCEEVISKLVLDQLDKWTSIPTDKPKHLTGNQADALWAALYPYIRFGDPESDQLLDLRLEKRLASRSMRRSLKYANRQDRREEIFRGGCARDGGPIQDPAYPAWLIAHGKDPARYLIEFDYPEYHEPCFDLEDIELPTWADQYGVMLGDLRAPATRDDFEVAT